MFAGRAGSMPVFRSNFADLLRRAGIGVGLYFVALFLHDPAQLALHGLEGVVDHFGERGVGAVVDAFFVGDQFVARRHGHVDPNAKRIAFLMSVIWLLDCHVASVDVIAELFESRRFIHDELIDLVGFVDAAVGDVDG